MKRTRFAAPVLIVLALTLSGCLDSYGGQSKHNKLTVLEASSLTGAFGRLVAPYRQHHHGGKVDLIPGSSAALVEQLRQGAPGGVLATADKRTMDMAVADHLIAGSPTLFATNVLELAVPAGNPGHIRTLRDLNKPGVKFLTCVPSAPCGASGIPLLRRDGVTARPASQETDVKSVLAKVEKGEADAGLVYHSDVVAAGGKVKGITVPRAAAAPNQYYIGVTRSAKHPHEARDWVALVTGPRGRRTLAQAGFGAPR